MRVLLRSCRFIQLRTLFQSHQASHHQVLLVAVSKVAAVDKAVAADLFFAIVFRQQWQHRQWAHHHLPR